MKKSRILAFIIAAALPFSLLSCTDNSGSISKTSTSSVKEEPSGREHMDIDLDSLTVPYEPIDLDDYRPYITDLLDDIKKPGNREKVKKDIDNILTAHKKLEDSNARSCLNYYLDFDNEELEAEYDATSVDYNIFNNLAKLAFTRCSENAEYKDLVKDLLTDDDIDYYTPYYMTPKRVEGYTRVDFDLSDERLDEYYDIYDDEDMDIDEKELRCAEIYLDILSEDDYDTLFLNYGRDFSPELAIELSDVVLDEIYSAYMYLGRSFISLDGADDILYEKADVDGEPFDIIKKYSPKLNSDIQKYANKIIDDELFCITSDEDAYNGSFTVELTATEDAFIFVNKQNDLQALSTSIHEFGHFYSCYASGGKPFNPAFCVDVAEIQSQGFEFLFTQFYDDIFGDKATAMKAYRVIDMLDSIIGGFTIGKFECTVLSQRDTLTPQDVVDIWHDIADGNLSVSFYEINHIFESPGYYLSYGTSALAAFDIWRELQKSPEKALKMYEKLSKVSPYSYDTFFCETLEKCGFSDVMSKNYIKTLSKEIRDYADTLE